MNRRQAIRELEVHWSRNKYLVLEKSAGDYNRIRHLLKDKENPQTEAYHQVLQHALSQETTLGGFRNAAQHVWGYFGRTATAEERLTFAALLEQAQRCEAGFTPVKRFLYGLAVKYGEQYLLDSNYFDEVREDCP